MQRTNQSEKMAERKTRVAILFGGRSAEHDVSRASAANVLRSLDPDRYETTLIGIARDGRWIVADGGNGAGTGAAELTIPENGPQLALLPGGQGRALVFESNASARELPPFDLVFPCWCPRPIPARVMERPGRVAEWQGNRRISFESNSILCCHRIWRRVGEKIRLWWDSKCCAKGAVCWQVRWIPARSTAVRKSIGKRSSSGGSWQAASFPG